MTRTRSSNKGKSTTRGGDGKKGLGQGQRIEGNAFLGVLIDLSKFRIPGI